MSETPQPPPPPEPPATGGGGNRPAVNVNADQVKAAFTGANRYDLGIIAAGVLAFIFSLLPYYKGSFSGTGLAAGFGDNSGSWTAWHGFFGWFGVLLVLLAAILLVTRLFGMQLLEASMTRLAVLGAFAVGTLCTLLAIFVNPLPGKSGSVSLGNGASYSYSKGHGIGFWLVLIVVIVGTVLAYLRKDATD